MEWLRLPRLESAGRSRWKKKWNAPIQTDVTGFTDFTDLAVSTSVANAGGKRSMDAASLVLLGGIGKAPNPFPACRSLYEDGLLQVGEERESLLSYQNRFYEVWNLMKLPTTFPYFLYKETREM